LQPWPSRPPWPPWPPRPLRPPQAVGLPLDGESMVMM
jgi:hypothetical protein